MQRRVRTLWTDLNGLTHGRYIPSARFDHATHHAVTTLVDEPGGRDPAARRLRRRRRLPRPRRRAARRDPPAGLGARHRRRRLRAARRRRPAAAAVPARRAGARRRRLAGARVRAPARLRARAVRARARRRPAAGGPAGGEGHRVYGVGLGGDPTGLALEYFDAVEAMDIELEGVLTEFSPGQMEINLGYGPALGGRRRGPARQGDDPRGRRPPRLPGDVPRAGPTRMSVGSGLHVNMSLVPVSGGANALHDPTAPEGLEHARPPGHRRADRSTTRRSPG